MKTASLRVLTIDQKNLDHMIVKAQDVLAISDDRLATDLARMFLDLTGIPDQRSTMPKSTLPIPAGTRVRFTRDDLGACTRTNLSAFVVGEIFGQGDEGIVAPFAHPAVDSPHASADVRKRMRDWVYVEVEARLTPGTKVYVGEHVRFLEVVT